MEQFLITTGAKPDIARFIAQSIQQGRHALCETILQIVEDIPNTLRLRPVGRIQISNRAQRSTDLVLVVWYWAYGTVSSAQHFINSALQHYEPDLYYLLLSDLNTANFPPNVVGHPGPYVALPPCNECGLCTGNFCDGCNFPLCTHCEEELDYCWKCRGSQGPQLEIHDLDDGH